MGSLVGFGTNLSPKSKTSSSVEDSFTLERLTTVLVDAECLLLGLVEGRGPWKVGVEKQDSSKES